MIEYILKRISKREYNKHKYNPYYIVKPYYKKGHGILYQMNNPPDGFRYCKIVGKKNILLCPSHLSKEFIQAINEYMIKRRKRRGKTFIVNDNN